MRIGIPTMTDQGKLAEVCDHFGSAPFFTIYDDSTDSLDIVSNSQQNHQHGTCCPMSILGGKRVDAVICKGMGVRALQSLNRAGITAYSAEAKTVEQVIQSHKENALKEMTIDHTCPGHSHDHIHGHSHGHGCH